MRTVVLGERPPELEAWLASRRARGQDRFDEMWEGEYHVAPAPHGRHGRIDHQLARLLGPRADAVGLRGSGPLNVGEADDYRVPDQAYLRDEPSGVFHGHAAVVVEIVSPGDETRHKLAFYFRRGLEELVIVDPDSRTVEWFGRGTETFVRVDHSPLLGLGPSDLVDEIDWPA